MTAAPDLTALARAAADAIASYVDAADKACAAVRKGNVSVESVDLASSEASLAVTRVRLRGKIGGDDGEELAGMATLLSRGIAREAWALRVVALAAKATGEQGRTAANG